MIKQTKDSPLGYIPLQKSSSIEIVKFDKPGIYQGKRINKFAEKHTLLDSAKQTALSSISVKQVGVFQINTVDPERFHILLYHVTWN